MWVDYLLIGTLIIFSSYFFWYFLFGKTEQPLTSNEADLIFAMHKKQTGCAGTKISNFLLRKGKIVGFRCECGYQYEQKRHLTQSVKKSFAFDDFSGWVDPSEIEAQSETNEN